MARSFSPLPSTFHALDVPQHFCDLRLAQILDRHVLGQWRLVEGLVAVVALGVVFVVAQVVGLAAGLLLRRRERVLLLLLDFGQRPWSDPAFRPFSGGVRNLDPALVGALILLAVVYLNSADLTGVLDAHNLVDRRVDRLRARGLLLLAIFLLSLFQAFRLGLRRGWRRIQRFRGRLVGGRLVGHWSWRPLRSAGRCDGSS